MRRLAVLALIAMMLSWTLTCPSVARADNDPAAKLVTQTPIKHVVVIFDENISFDHYFGTYPDAKPNLDGSNYFGTPKANTPAINGLTSTLLNNNPNLLHGGANPVRLDRSQAATCNNNNGYKKEQQAFDSGLLDNFTVTNVTTPCGFYLPTPPEQLVMDYYDGNTVTALWNYAQNYAMSDNFFDTEFGTTVMGHMNLLSGQTNGLLITAGSGSAPSVTVANGSIIANLQPTYDDCAAGITPNVVMTGKNVGDLMNAAGVSWGWFYGDFLPVTTSGGVASCIGQYNSHYAPFDYYMSTANPHHVAQTNLSKVGSDTCSDFSCPNHNYDLTTFYNALAAGNLPAVTYLKFAENDTGHPADSTPLAEQTQIVTAVNAIEESPFWSDTAIMILYDDTGGWYDHVAGPIVNFSEDASNDAITPGSCGVLANKTVPVPNDRWDLVCGCRFC